MKNCALCLNTPTVFIVTPQGKEIKLCAVCWLATLRKRR